MSSEDDMPVKRFGNRSPRRDDSSPERDENPASKRASLRKRTTAAEKTFDCCQQKEVPDSSSTLWCNGKSHFAPRLYHIACLEGDAEEDLEGDPWLCRECKNAESSQESYDSGTDWDVFAIRDKHIELDDDGNETAVFLIVWSGNKPNGRPWTPTWEPEENINKEGDLWKKYIESGEAAYENDEDGKILLLTIALDTWCDLRAKKLAWAASISEA
jgi:hypothetical protein